MDKTSNRTIPYRFPEVVPQVVPVDESRRLGSADTLPAPLWGPNYEGRTPSSRSSCIVISEDPARDRLHRSDPYFLADVGQDPDWDHVHPRGREQDIGTKSFRPPFRVDMVVTLDGISADDWSRIQWEEAMACRAVVCS